VDSLYASRILEKARVFQDKALQRVGSPFLYLSDEWYILADRPFPPLEHYGEMHQWEDGIGMVPSFLSQWRSLTWHSEVEGDFSLALITGEAFAPYLSGCISGSPWKNRVNVVAVRNRFWGPNVTVAGLVTGRDVIDALKDVECKEALIPSVMLNEDGRFLDDFTPADVAEASLCRIKVIPPLPLALFEELKLRSALPQTH
jgi:NifB/MoaA-like Fe-S oxidoreductase